MLLANTKRNHQPSQSSTCQGSIASNRSWNGWPSSIYLGASWEAVFYCFEVGQNAGGILLYLGCWCGRVVLTCRRSCPSYHALPRGEGKVKGHSGHVEKERSKIIQVMWRRKGQRSFQVFETDGLTWHSPSSMVNGFFNTVPSLFCKRTIKQWRNATTHHNDKYFGQRDSNSNIFTVYLFQPTLQHSAVISN